PGSVDDRHTEDAAMARLDVRGRGAGLDLMRDGHRSCDRDGAPPLRARPGSGAQRTGCVHADHPATRFEERSAGIARLNWCVEADDAGERLDDGGLLVRDEDGLVKRGDGTRGSDRGTVATESVAEA